MPPPRPVSTPPCARKIAKSKGKGSIAVGLFEQWKQRRAARHPYCTLLLAAGGSSERMGGEDKLLISVGGIPVLARALLAADRAACVDEIIVAAREDRLLAYADLCKAYQPQKPLRLIAGGQTRAESVYRAALEADERATLLAVHDAARPLVTPGQIDAVIAAAERTRAAAPAIPVRDTIKLAENGIVKETPERAKLFAVQTPQVFDAQLLRAALQSAIQGGAAVTDDCSAVERLGKEVTLVDGDEENIKITTPLDLLLAEAILQKRGEA